MTLLNKLWLPVFAMVASALATHHYLNQHTRSIGDDLEREWGTLLVPASLQPEYIPPEFVRETMPTAITLPMEQTLARTLLPPVAAA